MAFKAEITKDFCSDVWVIRAVRVGFETNDALTGFEFRTQDKFSTVEGVEMRGDEAKEFMQAMMDAAYDAGLRPSRAQDERHLKAHLEDMRTITMHQLGVKGGDDG